MKNYYPKETTIIQPINQATDQNPSPLSYFLNPLQPTMQFFKQVFGSRKSLLPAEPVFPGENFTLYQLDLPEGPSFASINQSYDYYPNKAFFSWHVLIELEVIDKNAYGHPVDTELSKLALLQHAITTFLSKYQTVHLVGRVTRNGFMDLLYYINTPVLSQEEVDAFCNGIMKERGINFTLENDPGWNNVGLIK